MTGNYPRRIERLDTVAASNCSCAGAPAPFDWLADNDPTPAVDPVLACPAIRPTSTLRQVAPIGETVKGFRLCGALSNNRKRAYSPASQFLGQLGNFNSRSSA
jgi:hypothetical protein